MLLEIKNLHASIDGNEILKGINLSVNRGEVHAIMGPNGSGKSTLTKIITGREEYEVTAGDVYFEGSSILEWAPEDRARAGIFLAFQYPVEIPGVSNVTFLRTALNEIRKSKGQDELEAPAFLKMLKEKESILELSESLMRRPVNEGFSGGEKKRNEIFQMAVLEPTLALLDETDSGLDIDALRAVANGVNKLKTSHNALVLVTHYQRLLDYVIPDYVHVMVDGRIVKSGKKELALELEDKGYDWIRQEYAAMEAGQ